MILLRLRKIKKSFQDKVLFEAVNLDIKTNGVVGLVGDNGAGKTTLAKIILGEESYDSGIIDTFNQHVKMVYLKQSSEYDAHNFNQMLINYTNLSSLLEKSSLIGLNKLKNFSNEKFNHLSGGEKTKMALTEVFNEPSDLIILDEPTNHLDYVGIDWLIKEIKNHTGSILVISHDRYFLDQVAEEIVELEAGKTKNYNGNYTAYRMEKQKQYEMTLHHYEEEKKKEKQITQKIERLSKWSHVADRDSTKKPGYKEYWRKKAKKKDIQIKSTIKRLEKMKQNGTKKPLEEQSVLFDFVSEDKMGKAFITAENITKKFGENILFNHSNFYIKRGERVGLIGINGCGKTTLIKMILGLEKNDGGCLWVSKGAKIAYLSQDVLDLDENLSVNEMIEKEDKIYQTKVRTFLASSGITERMINQKIKTLSLGERTRIKLVFLIVEENNVLILDEPTNHLDLHSREQLEKTLDSYQGTILIASHDRYLLEKITDKLLVFDKNEIKRMEVGYKEYRKPKDKNNSKMELLKIETRMTQVISELSQYKETDERYQNLDLEFKELIDRKRKLQEGLNGN